MSNLIEKQIKREEIYDGVVLHVVKDTIELPNGKESGLRALVFNTFCQLSAVDSQYMTTFSTFIEKKLAGGTTLEEIGWYVWPFYSIQKDFGIDPWEVWVRRCRQRADAQEHNEDRQLILQQVFEKSAKGFLGILCHAAVAAHSYRGHYSWPPFCWE